MCALRPPALIGPLCQEAALLSRDLGVRRFSQTRLFIAGRILHIVARKKSPAYEMRWASAEDFMELKVMPRMLLDHLPDNVYKVLGAVVDAQRPLGETLVDD